MKIAEVKALVTGGGTGIGLAIARLLREGGAEVAIAGRRADVLEKAAREIGAFPIAGDVGKEEDAIRIVGTAIAKLGDYNTLINNAGWGRFSPLVDLTLDDFRAIMDTNVFGAMLMARESARHFIEKSTGNIINISSTAGLRGFAGGTAYAASKWALGAMTECWRAELRKHNIRVTQINPSEVLTDFASVSGSGQPSSERKLRAIEIAHAVRSVLEMDNRGFVTDLTVFATNPD
jgi:3-oxoacyl-[acyl-carrier protein] reductase